MNFEQCQICMNYPNNYIQLSCDHNLCFDCLSNEYLQYLNNVLESQQINIFPCNICGQTTELDSATLAVIEQKLSSILQQEQIYNQKIEEKEELSTEKKYNNIEQSLKENDLQKTFRNEELEQIKFQLKLQMQSIDQDDFDKQLCWINNEQNQLDIQMNKFQNTLKKFVEEFQEKIQEKYNDLKNRQKIRFSDSKNNLKKISNNLNKKIQLFNECDQILKSNDQEQVQIFYEEFQKLNKQTFELKSFNINFNEFKQNLQSINEMIDYLDFDLYYQQQQNLIQVPTVPNLQTSRSKDKLNYYKSKENLNIPSFEKSNFENKYQKIIQQSTRDLQNNNFDNFKSYKQTKYQFLDQSYKQFSARYPISNNLKQKLQYLDNKYQNNRQFNY